MRQLSFESVIIFSLGQGTKAEELRLLNSRGIEVVIPVTSRMSDTPDEQWYLTSMSKHGILMDLLRENKVGTAMLRYGDGEAFMYDIDEGSQTALGKLVSISENLVGNYPFHLYRPDIDQYYTLEGVI